jgi:hypothetical protein
MTDNDENMKECWGCKSSESAGVRSFGFLPIKADPSTASG